MLIPFFIICIIFFIMFHFIDKQLNNNKGNDNHE